MTAAGQAAAGTQWAGDRSSTGGWEPGRQALQQAISLVQMEGRHLCAGLLATPGKHLHTHCCLLPVPCAWEGGQEGLPDRLS